MAAVRTLMAVTVLLLVACAPFPEPPPHVPPPPDAETPAPGTPASSSTRAVPARTVYIIDGDADYLYHDAHGKRLRADEVALQETQDAARAAIHGEVFIFHLRTGIMRKLWGGRGGTFEYYRFGHLISRTQYARDPHDTAGLGDEARVLERLNLRDTNAHKTAYGTAFSDTFRAPLSLAYFGHEIMVGDDRARGLAIAEFTRGLERIAQALGVTTESAGGRPYDLIVLSTCYGGTPDMMRALMPLAEYAVASPAYLHLSYLDAAALATQTTQTGDAGSREARRQAAQRLADTIAATSFDRLRGRTTTEVTVAVYDLETLAPPPVPSLTSGTGVTRHAETSPVSPIRRDAWDDCMRVHADLPVKDLDRGITLRYQPPRFGARRVVVRRSAWQCLQTSDARGDNGGDGGGSAANL